MEASSAFDTHVSTLRRAQTDHSAFAEGLAVRLAEALPARVTVERSGWGVFRKRRVARLIVDFESHRFTLTAKDNEWIAERVPLVHGVGLCTERLTLIDWFGALIADVEASAGEQSAATATLHEFLLS